MTSQISPLHLGATCFLNLSRDCSSFSIKDIGVKDVFGLSSCEGFNLGSGFVGSSTYFSTDFVFPNPRERQNSKKNSLQNSRNFPITTPLEKGTFPYSSKAPKSAGTIGTSFPTLGRGSRVTKILFKFVFKVDIV